VQNILKRRCPSTFYQAKFLDTDVRDGFKGLACPRDGSTSHAVLLFFLLFRDLAGAREGSTRDAVMKLVNLATSHASIQGACRANVSVLKSQCAPVY
jgi:hypothetical protein